LRANPNSSSFVDWYDKIIYLKLAMATYEDIKLFMFMMSMRERHSLARY
jgi:hypothetical protein